MSDKKISTEQFLIDHTKNSQSLKLAAGFNGIKRIKKNG
jgi:hypothetical protein